MPQLVFNPISGEFDFIRRPGEGQVTGEVPAGVKDGVNKNFTTAAYFNPSSMRVYLNGQRLLEGASEDYTLAESGGLGTGFDTIILALAPITNAKPDVLLVDYIRS